MPLDVLGRTPRYTDAFNEPILGREARVIFETASWMGIDYCKLLVFNEECLVSASPSARVDYVPALCTHRPSLLPIGLCW